MPERFLLVHGLGLSSTIWDSLTALAGGAQILTPDLPGHGHGPRSGYDFPALWAHLESLLPATQWGQTVLVLHSMSAALLPEIMLSQTKPKAIILIEGNLIGSDATWSRQISAHAPAAFEEWLARVRRTASMVLRSQLKTRHTAADLARWAEGFTQVDATALREIAARLISRSVGGDNARALEKLGVPTRYLRGALSEDWSEGRALLASIGVPITDIPDAAHYPMIDNPEATWEAITSPN